MPDSIPNAIPKPSATVVLLREDNSTLEVLLLQRNAKIKFHGGAWVFPGGKVDQTDYPREVEHFEELDAAEKSHSYQRAALRETHEEAGLVLQQEDLHLFSTWLTPVNLPKRFDAWFYLAHAPSDEIVIDDGEIKDYQWITPTEALRLQGEGKISLPPPTFVTLTYLSKFHQASEAITSLTDSPMHFRPRIAPFEGGFISLYEEDAGYRDTDPKAEGNQHRLIKTGDKFQYISPTESPTKV